ncbi:hypothetical protein M422DRAFT_252799 [Sphaerobolus stellatus SS14]|uniref:Hydrophobin n=1 Tax=Sphaerobolus stellatus (strain SS14) TaxID=990650 RepID=A0A0C9VY24_SPHS4|nr:hypothetical protein M422DRAFT_252799 [Sphaerobolus stellatus SS14]
MLSKHIFISPFFVILAADILQELPSLAPTTTITDTAIFPTATVLLQCPVDTAIIPTGTTLSQCLLGDGQCCNFVGPADTFPTQGNVTVFDVLGVALANSSKIVGFGCTQIPTE